MRKFSWKELDAFETFAEIEREKYENLLADLEEDLAEARLIAKETMKSMSDLLNDAENDTGEVDSKEVMNENKALRNNLAGARAWAL